MLNNTPRSGKQASSKTRQIQHNNINNPTRSEKGMRKSLFKVLLLMGIIMLFIPGTAVSQLSAKPPEPFGPVPSPRQLKWQEMEHYMFIHFNMNTFTGKEWGDGKESPKLFNPTKLDCRQWARVCKEAGLKGIIITAKHHDGFCLWPSKYTDHSVKYSPFRKGKGDVLKELSAACKEYGLKFGVYLSPWDRHDPTYGDSPAYNEKFKNELREVLTSYGDVFEVWFDGANGEGPNGKKQIYDWPGFIGVVRECQPDAVIFSDGGPDIRWVGDEDGYAGESNWSLLRRDEVYPGYPKYQELVNGHANGTHWVPAECDVSIRPGWYYHPEQDTALKSVKNLIDIYFNSVGHNGSMLLNVPVNKHGLISEDDAKRLAEFKQTREEIFIDNHFKGAAVTASQVRGNDPRFNASNVIDSSGDTFWSTDDTVKTGTLEFSMDSLRAINCLMIQEYIPLGQRVEKFSVDAWGRKAWVTVCNATTIGYKRIVKFNTIVVQRLRVTISQSRACPVISNVEAFFDPSFATPTLKY
jgi:alpha-L-fucosidase